MGQDTLRIAKDVYFRKFGEQVYLRHVGLAKDFLMNEITFDILDFIRSHEDCQFAELLSFLCGLYEVTDEAELEADIQEFVSQLKEEQILESGDKEAEQSEDIRGLIQQKCFDNHWLFTACLELTYRCNEKCIHCYVDAPYDSSVELSTAEYRDVIDQLKELGCMGILLTGGEATLRSDFFEIAEYIKSQGILFDIYTNGLMLSDQDLERMIAMKPNSISFSFYGGTPEVHDRITTVTGSFEKSLKSLMTVKCAGVDTYIKTVVMNDNAEDYENLLRLGQRLCIPVLSSLSIMPSHGGKSAEPFRLLDQERYIQILELQKKYNVNAFDRQVGKRGRYICASGLDALSIDPFGNVHPCNAHPLLLGNVRSHRLRDIWENSEELKALRDIRPTDLSPECQNCEELDWCGVCMGSAIRENDRLAPCSDTCSIAKAYHYMYKNH